MPYIEVYSDSEGRYRWRLRTNDEHVAVHSPGTFDGHKEALADARRVGAAFIEARRGEGSDEHVIPQLVATVHYEDAGDGWFVATIPGVPGAISEGATRAEARENVFDALATLLTPDDAFPGEGPPTADDDRLRLISA